MARNRTSRFGAVLTGTTLSARRCTGEGRAVIVYLHDKLAAYLKKQCPYLSGDDFEDVISLTLAKCLEDFPLFQNRSCLTTWFRYGIHFLHRIQSQKPHLLPPSSLSGPISLCVSSRYGSVGFIYSKRTKRSCRKSF